MPQGHEHPRWVSHPPLFLYIFYDYSNNISHYVAFIRKQLSDDKASWVLFNDEKVVEVIDVEEMKKFAYIYFFKRV